MPTLVVMVGLPRSGKSTLARQFGFPIVSPDAIRLAIHGQRHLPSAEPVVWMTAKYMVKALFLAGHMHVVLDATSINAHQRAQWRSREWKTKVYVVETDPDVCIQRAIDTDQLDLIPVINSMYEEFCDHENAFDLGRYEQFWWAPQNPNK